MDIDQICSICKLPPEVSKGFKKTGVTRLYEWQQDCICSSDIINGACLIYCAPTSGGKTLIAELLILVNVISLGKTAILVLPYVSLVLEKERDLKRLLSHYNKYQSPRQRIRVKSVYGQVGVTKKGLNDQIIICTIEKANSILNSFISSGRIDRLGIIAIDELHVLGDADRGFSLIIY